MAGQGERIEIVCHDVKTIREILIGNGHVEGSVLHRLGLLETARLEDQKNREKSKDRGLSVLQGIGLIGATEAMHYLLPWMLHH